MKQVIAIVSCYNQGEIISSTIQSLIHQTYQNLKIVIVDDGSTDKPTICLLKDFEKNYQGKIKVLFKENGHVSSARNYGIKNSDCEYVFISDGDDTYSRDMIERFVDVLETNSGVGIVSSWIRTFGVAEWLVKPSGGHIEDFLHKNNCPAQAMIRRSCWEEVGGYDENMKNGYEDWDFNINVSSKGWRIAIIEDALIYYCVAESSMNSGSYKKRLEIMSYIIRKHKPVFEKYLLELLLAKENALQEKNLENLKRIKSQEDFPEVTFGDGGLAFAIMAFSILGHKDK